MPAYEEPPAMPGGIYSCIRIIRHFKSNALSWENVWLFVKVFSCHLEKKKRMIESNYV